MERLLRVPFRAPSGKKHEIVVKGFDGDESQQVAEAAQYLRTLQANGQLAFEGEEPRPAGATHLIRRTKDGELRLERIGFSGAAD